ncbi:MAG: right-handed parallel beta-helix repeat-containing protein [Ignavibacteria bacterium]|nr:right-handed parallel beta-helix repeat-containing protein [Ignavibacteria bacterium]
MKNSAATISIYNVESELNCQYAINVGNGTNGLNIVKCKFNNNTVGGWRTGTAELISNITMDSSEVKGNGIGVNNGFGIFLAATTPGTNTADNITIKNSDFSNNLKKGMYFEKLRNALIDNVIIDNCGTDAAYGFNNGIDINLKYDSYSNITIQNCSITNSGVMGTATDVNNPSALAIKARDDSPSYNTDPATLTGFTLKNCFVSGPVNGLRFGEFNKTNNSPTGNTVIENHFGGAYSNKAIVNKTANNISVSCNWYGSAVPGTVFALHGSGISFIPFLTNGTDDQFSTPGFQIVPGSCNGLGPVKNITQITSYPTIQLAVNAANNGDVIEIDPGTYNEQVLINKEVTIKNSGVKPVINFTGTPALVSGKLTIFEITVPNVTIDSLDFEVDLSKLGSAIIASASNINNLSIKNNDINPYKSGTLISFGLRNAVNINYGSYRISNANPSNIFAEKNNISYNFYGTPLDPNDDAGFRSGFATDEGGGTFTLNTIQTISSDIEARFGGAGDINVTSNNINGAGVNLAEYNGGAGNINVTGNIFDGTFGNTYSSSLRLKNNQQIKTTLVSGNTFQNHNWGISLENYRAVTITNNTFTPVSASTVFRHITVNTKLLASSSATITQTAIDAAFTNNTFNGSGTPGGTGMAFYNHDSDNDTYGTFTLGSSGNENNFNTGIANFIALDPSAGPSWPSAFPENNLGAGAITTMACWATDVNIENNKFDVGSGLQLPSAMNFTQRTILETALIPQTR